MEERLDVSERRACEVVGQPRSTQRYKPQERDEEKRLVSRMVDLSSTNPRYGYRRITALLRREQWKVNRKRVYRLWKREGLKVPAIQRKRRRLGSSVNGCVRHRAVRKNEVWSYDFVMDQTSDGRRLKMLPIVDEYTRECLRIEMGRWMRAEDVVAALQRLFQERGTPDHIRSDNGPEFIAAAVKEWLQSSGVQTLYIEPGSPWENAYSETFNSRFEDELLDREQFDSEREAQVLIEEYRRHYNERRPHSALGYQTPSEFSAACVPPGSAALRPAARTPQARLS